jgi:hypothetical protein
MPSSLYSQTFFYFQIHITTTPSYFPPNPLKREPLFSSSPITCNFDSFPSFVLVPLVPVPFSPISQSKATYTPFNNNTMCLMLLTLFLFIFDLQFLQIQCFSLCSYSSLIFNFCKFNLCVCHPQAKYSS